MLQDVSINRGQRCVVPTLNLHLPIGEMLGVLGPNGAGKTTLLSACVGELPVTKGDILYDKQRLAQGSAKQLARHRAVLPQSSHLTFDLPVVEIIQMGAYPFAEVGQSEVQRWTNQAIEAADVAAFANKKFSELSGGEQQRVQFARVMVQTLAIKAINGHAYLFLDEPTASLDLKHQGLLIRAVRHLVDTGQVGAFVILHDLNMASRWCDQVLLLSPDQAPLSGHPATVLNQQTLEAVYGVSMRVSQHPFRQNQLLILTNDH